MKHHYRNLVITLHVAISLIVFSFQYVHAVDVSCADGNDDACWARFYTPDNGEEESRVYFRIFKACQDGVQVGVAANIVDSHDIYIKQYAADQAPDFRLLTGVTTVPLDFIPEGVDIEWTSEGMMGYGGTVTVNHIKIVNMGWGKTFDTDYDDSIMVADPNYGYSETTVTGIVRDADIQNCKLFGSPILNAPPVLKPIVDCVTITNGILTSATFGYSYGSNYDAIIPRGTYNRLNYPLAKPVFVNLPTYFTKKVHHNVFTVNMKTTSLTWTLGDATAVATKLSPQC